MKTKRNKKYHDSYIYYAKINYVRNLTVPANFTDIDCVMFATPSRNRYDAMLMSDSRFTKVGITAPIGPHLFGQIEGTPIIANPYMIDRDVMIQKVGKKGEYYAKYRNGFQFRKSTQTIEL